MRLNILKEGFTPIKMENIEAFEKKIGYILPSEYKDFLLKNNECRCHFDSLIFKYEDRYGEIQDGYDEFSEVTSLYYLNNDGVIIDEENNPEKKYIRILEGLGASTGAYLSLNPETYGQIYWCDVTHEGIFYHVANNLEEFLNSFTLNEDCPEDYDENGNLIISE